MKTTCSIGAAALAAAFVLAPGAGHAEEEASGRVAVGQAAPDFTLPDLDGSDRTLSALRGEKEVLLVFFRGAW